MLLAVLDLSAVQGIVALAVAVLGAVGAVGASLFTIRSNVAKVWREQAEGEKAAREEAEREILRQRELKHTALNEANALRLRTDLMPVVEALGRITTMLAEHDARMTEAHGRIVAVLGEITNELKALRRALPRAAASS
jgi:hypothetical protein